MCIYVKPDPDDIPKPVDKPIETPIIDTPRPQPVLPVVPVNSGGGGGFSFRPEQYEIFGQDEFGMVNSEPIILNNERYE